MAEISKITLLNGTTYDLKDAQARADIADIQSAIAGGLNFLGETTTALADNATTNPITINSASVTAKKGDLAVYGKKEFLFNGTKWIEMGDLSLLKALAYKDSASGSYTPAGTVTRPTFEGSDSTVTITATDNTSGNYQPKGTVSKPTFTGSPMTATGKFTPDGTVTVTTKTTSNKTATVAPAESGTATYTPGGTIAQPVFTGSPATFTGKFTPSGNVTLDTISYTEKNIDVSPDSTRYNYQPAGTVSAPNINLNSAGSTTTVNSITDVGTLPSMTTTVANEVLTIGFDAGTLPTKGANTTVKTGDASYSASAPSFTGSKVRLYYNQFNNTYKFEGNEDDISVDGTPDGTISAPTFEGTPVRLVTGNIAVPSTYTGVFTGTEGDISATGTPEGDVSQPTFSGTKAQLSGTTKASGTVSQPTFQGTPATITVS